MKRRIVTLLVLSILALTLALTLTACGGSEECKDGNHKLVLMEKSLPIEPNSDEARENFPDFYNDYMKLGDEAVYEMYHGVYCENCSYQGVAKHDFKVGEQNNEGHYLTCECGFSTLEEHQAGVDTCKCGYVMPKYTVEFYESLNNTDYYRVRILETATGDIVIPETWENGFISVVYGPVNTENPGSKKDVPGITSITLPETVTYLSISASNLTKIVSKGETDLVSIDIPKIEEIDAPKSTLSGISSDSIKNLKKFVIGKLEESAFNNIKEVPENLEITVNNPNNGFVHCPLFVKTLNLGDGVVEIVAVRNFILTDEQKAADKLEVVNAPYLEIIRDTSGGGVRSGFNGEYLSPNITTVNAPKLREVASDSFAGLKNMKALDLPSLVKIGYRAFADTGLESFTIPNTVTLIQNFALSSNANLKSVYYNAKNIELVEDSDYSTFLDMLNNSGENAEGGIEITIGKDVKTIPMGFCDSIYVTSVTFENGSSTEKICASAFYGATGLTSITLPDSVTVIKEAAFRECRNLVSVTLSSNLQFIGNSAFESTGIETITIPNSVTEIENYAFRWCESLATINAGPDVYVPVNAVDLKLSLFEEVNGHYYFGKTLVGLKSTVTELRPREGTKEIYFWGINDGDCLTVENACGNITSVYVPAGLEIGFADFYNLTSIVFNEGVTAVSANALEGCEKLTSVTLPSTLKTIGVKAFYNCDLLEEITLPAGLESMGDNALGDCALLETINVLGNFEITFDMVAGSNLYKGTAYRNGYYIGKTLVGVIDPTKFLYIKDGTTEIKEGVFDGLNQIKYVYVPETVTEYGERVFKDCTNLTLILEGDNFSGYNQHGLQGLNRTRKNKCVTEDGFEYIDSTSGITITKYFGDNAIVEIPETINGKNVVIVGNGSEAIADTKLTVTKVILPEKVSQIAFWAFIDMASLVEVNVPKSVAYIGNNAFAGCTSLTAVAVDYYTAQELEQMGMPGASENITKFTAWEIRGGEGIPTHAVFVETLSYTDSEFVAKLSDTYAAHLWIRYVEGNPFYMQ